MSIPERLKTRLAKDRPMATITLRISVDVVESLKEIAPHKGFLRRSPVSLPSAPSRLIDSLLPYGAFAPSRTFGGYPRRPRRYSA